MGASRCPTWIPGPPSGRSAAGGPRCRAAAVPDDRFADLGPSGTRAGDKLADLDRQEPERPAQPPRRPGRYTWVVGVAFVILIAVVMVNTIGHGGGGAGGLLGGPEGARRVAPGGLGPA